MQVLPTLGYLEPQGRTHRVHIQGPTQLTNQSLQEEEEEEEPLSVNKYMSCVSVYIYTYLHIYICINHICMYV